MTNNRIEVDATEGVSLETEQQIQALSANGISEFELVIKNSDQIEDEDLLDLMEEELRELLIANGLDGENTWIKRL